MSELTFDFSFLFEKRPPNEGREDGRRCLAIRKDGSPCRAWALWNAPRQFCAAHHYGARRKRDEMTTAIRREQARRHSPICDCAAYEWPHRRGNGFCSWQGEPLGYWPTPAGQRQPGKKRRRGQSNTPGCWR